VDKCAECNGRGWTERRTRTLSEWVDVCNSCAGSGSKSPLDSVKGIAQLAGLSVPQAWSLMEGPGVGRRGLNFATAERALRRLLPHLDPRA
jgi:hypothetical protein